MDWKNIPVNDEKWSCMVTMLAEGNVTDQFLVTSFENTYHPKLIVNLNRKVLKQHFQWGGIKRSSHYLATSKTDEKSRPSSSAKNTAVKQDAKEIKNYILKVKNSMLQRFESQPSASLNSGSEFPNPGPHVYFVLTGFKDARLVISLLEAYVPVNLAISVQYAWKTNAGKSWVEEMNKERGSMESKRKGTSMMSVRKTGTYQYTTSYWEDLDELIRNHPQKELFNNFVVVSHKVEEVRGATIEMYGQIMFDAVKALMFRWVDEMRTYIHYVGCVDLVEIPKGQVDDLLMIPYQLLLEMVPLENTTIELILYCIVEVIEERMNKTVFSSKASMFPLNKLSQEANHGEEPVLLHYKDKIGIDYVDIDCTGLDIKEIHLNIYKNMPYSTLWRCYNEQDEVSRISKQSQLYKMWKCGGVKMPFDMFQLHLHQMIFTKLINLSERNEEIVDNEFSQIAFKFEEMSIDDEDNMKLSHFYHCRELLSMFDYVVKGNMFNSLRAEELKRDLFLQCLQNAFNKYSWSYYHYLTLTDKIVFWFKNEFNYEGPTTSELFTRLDTNVPFREFHALPKKEKWLEINREKVREADEEARRAFVERYLPDFNINSKSAKNLQIPLSLIEKGPTAERFVYNTESLVIDEEIGKFVSFEELVVTIRRDNRELSETITVDSFGNTFVFKINISNQQEEPVKSLFVQAKNDIIFNLYIDRIKTANDTDSAGKSISVETDVKLDVVATRPNGLILKFVPIDEQVCVYQKYLNEELYWDNGVEENLRVSMNNGSVIQFMLNGDITILHPDSTITTIYEAYLMNDKELMMKIDLLSATMNPPCEKERTVSVKVPKTKKNTFQLMKKSAKREKNSKNNETARTACTVPEERSRQPSTLKPLPSRLKIVRYDVLDSSGVRWSYKDDELCNKCQEYMIRAAHNPGRELYVKRGEISNSYYKYDGILHSKYSDGTLITSIPHEVMIEPIKSDTENQRSTTQKRSKPRNKIPSPVEQPDEDEEFVGFENEYLQEHPKYATVHFTKANACSVRLEESTCLARNGDGTYFIHLDETTTIKIGKELITITSKKKTKTPNEPRNVTVTEIRLQNGRLIRQPIFKCTDSLMRSLCVYSDGKYECVCLDESSNAKDSVAEDILYTNRFFVLNRDLSGWEFVPGFRETSVAKSTTRRSEILESVVEEEKAKVEVEGRSKMEKNVNDLTHAHDSSTSYLNSFDDLSSNTTDSTEVSIEEEKVDPGDELVFKIEINNKKLFKSKTQRFNIPFKLLDYKTNLLRKKDLSRDLPLSYNWLFALPGVLQVHGTPAHQDIYEYERMLSKPCQLSKPLAVLYEKYHSTLTYIDMYKLYKSSFINYLNYHREMFQLYTKYVKNPTFYYFADGVVPEPTINVKALIYNGDEDVKIQELLRAKEAITLNSR